MQGLQRTLMSVTNLQRSELEYLGGLLPANIVAARWHLEGVGSSARVRARALSIFVRLIERTDPSGHVSDLAEDFLADFGHDRGS